MGRAYTVGQGLLHEAGVFCGRCPGPRVIAGPGGFTMLRGEERLDQGEVERERSVDGRVRDLVTGVVHVRPAEPRELADDLGRSVDDRRSAAAAVDGAGDVLAVDPLAARPAGAGAGARADVVLR